MASTGASMPGAALSGGLYFPWDQDDLVAQKVLEIEGCDRYRAPLINEGGAIHVDGQGTALVTEQVLAQPEPQSRSRSRPRSSGTCRSYLGVRHRHLAGRGRGRRRNRRPHRQPGLLREARRGAAHLDRRQRDPQYAVSRDALERLEAARDARGRRARGDQAADAGTAALHGGGSRAACRCAKSCAAACAGMRLAASYVNFYIANGGIVMPLARPAHRQGCRRASSSAHFRAARWWACRRARSC